MGYLYNTKETKTIRRNLRKRQTLAEGLLWNLIRNKKCNGLKFFRQYSVGNFVLDFYCPKIRLAIEIDGGQHAQVTKRRDENRTRELSYQNIRVIRFWNNEVLENKSGVFDKIMDQISNPS